MITARKFVLAFQKQLLIKLPINTENLSGTDHPRIRKIFVSNIN